MHWVPYYVPASFGEQLRLELVVGRLRKAAAVHEGDQPAGVGEAKVGVADGAKGFLFRRASALRHPRAFFFFFCVAQNTSLLTSILCSSAVAASVLALYRSRGSLMASWRLRSARQ